MSIFRSKSDIYIYIYIYAIHLHACGLQLLKFTQQSVAFKEDFPELLLALHNFPWQESFESTTYSYFRSNLRYYIKKY